ncbi:MAG: hypothetical protein ABSE81_06160 [Candidatus Omnitrophota bacterium]|jgi:hypothetical protein
MLDNKTQEKKYFKTTFLIVAFLLVGPFALPLVWFNPRLNKKVKILVTVIVIALSYWLGIMLLNSINSISRYYQQLNQMTF